jgi:nicotinamidase-related amidase
LRGEEPRPRNHRAHGATEPNDLDPSQCALLVLDCQPEVLSSVANPRAVVFRTNSAIDIVRRLGGTIGFTRLAFEYADYRFTPSTNKEFATLAYENRLRNGTSGADLHPGLAITPGDIVMRKTRLGAFSTTNLDESLTNLGITTLILAGIHASGAVLSTVREAADKDYRLIILADCISDTDTATQRLLMERVFPQQAEILTTNELERALAGRGVAGAMRAHVS